MIYLREGLYVESESRVIFYELCSKLNELSDSCLAVKRAVKQTMSENAETSRKCRDFAKMQRLRENAETSRKCRDFAKIQRLRENAETLPKRRDFSKTQRLRENAETSHFQIKYKQQEME